MTKNYPPQIDEMELAQQLNKNIQKFSSNLLYIEDIESDVRNCIILFHIYRRILCYMHFILWSKNDANDNPSMLESDNPMDDYVVYYVPPAVEETKIVRLTSRDYSEKTLHERAVGSKARAKLFEEKFNPSCCRQLNSRHPCNGASIFEVQSMRDDVWGSIPDRSERSDRLFNLLRHLSVATSSNTNSFVGEVRKIVDYKIGTLTVCAQAFAEALAMNQTGDMFQSCLRSVKAGAAVKVVKKRVCKRGARGEAAVGWLVTYTNNYGHFSPTDKDVVFTDERKQYAVYARYVLEFIGKHLTSTHFYGCWKKYCPHIKCIVESPGFKKCSTCSTVDDQICKVGLNKYEKRFLEIFYDRHLAQQRNERADLEASKQLSTTRQGKITMIIDSMDQKKSEIPGWNSCRSSNQTEAMQKLNKVGQVVIGVRVWYYLNSPQESLYLYVLDSILKKDSNSTIQCLQDTLTDLYLKFNAENQKFPEFLRINFDNASDNKNQYVLGYLSDLIRRQTLLNITGAFLYRGHTHSEIDQSFSSVAELLRRNRTVTHDQFDAVLRTVVHQTEIKVFVIRLDHIHDCKTYYEGHLCNIEGIRTPHQFRFWNHDGKCRSQFRMWAGTKWYPHKYRLVQEEAKVEVSLNNVMREMERSTVDNEGSAADSVLDSVRGTLPLSVRLANEENLSYVECILDRKMGLTC